MYFGGVCEGTLPRIELLCHSFLVLNCNKYFHLSLLPCLYCIKTLGIRQLIYGNFLQR